MRLERHGLAAELPRGWSGRLFSRPGGGVTLHAGSFPVALDDGEFGDESTGRMPPGAAFAALTEYRPDRHLQPGSGLFASRRLPAPLDPTAFSARRLAHPRPGQLGAQHFFTLARRPLCLYVVLAAAAGPGRRHVPAGRHPQIAALNALLRSVQVSERG